MFFVSLFSFTWNVSWDVRSWLRRQRIMETDECVNSPQDTQGIQVLYPQIYNKKKNTEFGIVFAFQRGSTELRGYIRSIFLNR
jgi:hypothetical protein